MSLFGSILQKLGMRKAAAATGDASAPASEPAAAPQGQPAPAAEAGSTGAPAAPAAAQPVPVVDVMAKLEEMAAANPQKLNWKTSIVDLLKLLGIDSSLEARRELARELDAPADKFSDSASLNIWLHRTVLQKLADNGGNIPPELL